MLQYHHPGDLIQVPIVIGSAGHIVADRIAVFVKFLGSGSQDEYVIIRGVNVEIIVVPLIDGVVIPGGILVNELL